MIQPQDIFNIRFYEKSPFYGSFRKMHYRIEKKTEEDEKKLEVVTWPGPYNFETTDDSLKESALFPFSEEGLNEVCDHLNKVYTEKFEKQ